MIKNLDLISEMNTQHINTPKYVPESYNLGLSNSPKNTKYECRAQLGKIILFFHHIIGGLIYLITMLLECTT